MSGLKIVVIGGGSSYTPELIEGLLNRYHEMPVASLWLVDIEEGKEKVEIIAGLARRMIAKAGLTIEVVATLDRESALRDADFVCSQFRAGCLDARISDERISLKYGLIGRGDQWPRRLRQRLSHHSHRPGDRCRYGATVSRRPAAELYQPVGDGDRSDPAPQPHQSRRPV